MRESTNRVSAILDPDGRPFELESTHRNGSVVSAKEFAFVRTLDQWMTALTSTRASAQFKIQDPFSYHPWVFAAAMAIATTASNAPYTIFTETPEQLAYRKAKHRGSEPFTPRAGRRRCALARHGKKRHTWKAFTKQAMEPVYDHPLVQLFEKPNTLQIGNQLWLMTILWMAVRGECFWLMTDDDGNAVSPMQQPTMVWPLSPDLFSPVFDGGAYGTLVAWDVQLPKWMPRAVATSLRMRVPVEATIQFKLPNPLDLVRGMSRLTPVISSIETDMMATSFLRSLLDNRAVPSGILQYDGSIDPKDESEIQAKIQDRHGGPDKAGKMLLLQGGLKYVDVALSPQDLEAQTMKKTGREEVLGVLVTPPSALGLQDIANYATAQIFDKSFWEKAILPILIQIESSIDASLFFTETDDVFGMFDTSNVDAFRAGMKEKVDIATALCSDKIHMPPKQALTIVGLDVADYEAGDKAFVSALQVPAVSVAATEEITPGKPPQGYSDSKPGIAPAAGGDGEQEPAPAKADGRDAGSPPASPSPLVAGWKKATAGARWNAFVKTEIQLEKKMKSGYKKWVKLERKKTTERLDAEARRVGAKGWSMVVKATGIDLSVVIPSLEEMQNDLDDVTRFIYSAIAQATYDLTLDDLGGPAVFNIDDGAILGVMQRRADKFLETVPDTLRTNLYESLAQGLKDGDTIQQLRTRIGEVYDLAASDAKTLTVARTETAGLMNDLRYEMFDAQGFKKLEWTTANDEHVRADHEIFGSAGPQPIGFDYMTIAENASGGSLTHPGDPSAPAGEVINCRCVQIPVE